MNIPACPLHVTDTVNTFYEGVLQSYAKLQKIPIYLFSQKCFNSSKFGIYLTGENSWKPEFKIPCFDVLFVCALRMKFLSRIIPVSSNCNYKEIHAIVAASSFLKFQKDILFTHVQYNIINIYKFVLVSFSVDLSNFHIKCTTEIPRSGKPRRISCITINLD